MPYLFKLRPASFVSGMSSGQYSDDVDVRLCELAADLLDCGWDVSYRDHYAYVSTNAPMSSFSGNFVFWQVVPPAGYGGLIPMVIDALPDGYEPPPTHYIFAVTGTTDAQVTHDAVIAAMMTFDGRIEVLGHNPDDPNPNTLLGWKEYPGDFASTRAPLHANRAPFGSAAVGLHTNFTSGLSGGGYVARCQPNGDPGNFVSIFISRDTVGGINPNKPFFVFAKAFPLASPVLGFTGLVPETNCSRTQSLDYTPVDCLFAIGPSHCLMSMATANPNVNAHIAAAALSLPILDGPEVQVAAFAVSGGIGGSTAGFRTQLQATNLGALYYNLNGVELFQWIPGTTKGVSVMNLWPESDALKWENGLAQIQEPWVGFQPNPSFPPPTLGKLPGAIVTTAAFNAFTAPVRKWDGVAYRAFTHNNAGGTLWFRTDETIADPTCTVAE